MILHVAYTLRKVKANTLRERRVSALALDIFGGRRVENQWPAEATPGNVLLFESTGFDLDLVEEALRRSVAIVAHQYPRGWHKIPVPGEFNCFAYCVNILYLWVGAACPAWWLGSLRTSWCALLHIFNRRSGYGSAFLIFTLQCLLQLPPPFNYASSHAILGLNRLFREAPWTKRPGEWTLLEATTHTLPALGHGIESLVFVAACIDTALRAYRY